MTRTAILLVIALFFVETEFAQEAKTMTTPSGKKVVMIIASRNFRDEEFS